MDLSEINIGIIGLGYWGPNLLRNFAQSEGCHVAACCDLDAKRRAKFSSQYPRTKFVENVQAIFDDPEIQAVAIATPIRTHYDLAKRALQAGKHVFVEKPLTTHVGEAQELCELAQKKGLILQVDHVFVYSPAVTKTKELIDSRTLGEIYFIDCIRINLGLFQRDVNVLWDLAPHDLSIIDYIIGKKPVSLVANGSSHTPSGIEDIAYLNINYGDGLIANVHVNWMSPVKIRSMIVGGSKKSLVYNDLDPSEKIRIYDRGFDSVMGDQLAKVLIKYRSGDMWSPNLSHDEPLQIAVRDFIDSIRHGRNPLVDAGAGLRLVRILEAAQQSLHQQGKRVFL
jgi:predicted dehydrogenase